MTQPSEGRETLGFLAGAFAGPLVLAVVLGLASGFSTDNLKVALGALLFCVVPGTVLFGLPTYYAIRRTRVPGRWWTTAFGAAISAMPVVAFAAMGMGGALGISEQGRLIVFAIMGLGAAACGALGGLVFWLLVFKDAARATGTPTA